MASDKDDALSFLQDYGSWDSEDTIARVMIDFRRAAVAELVECLTEIDAWLKTGDGDGAAIQARADVILSRHQAGLGKGEDR